MSSWDAERAYTLAVEALNYLARTYPKGVSHAPLHPYHDAALAAQDAGDLAAFKEALSQMMYEGRRVARAARDSRQGRGAA